MPCWCQHPWRHFWNPNQSFTWRYIDVPVGKLHWHCCPSRFEFSEMVSVWFRASSWRDVFDVRKQSCRWSTYKGACEKTGLCQGLVSHPSFTLVPLSESLFFLPFLLPDPVLVLLVQMSSQYMKIVFHKGTSIWKSLSTSISFSLNTF